MAAIMVEWSKAPGWARHTSSFARDARCEAVVVIYGEKYDEVYTLTERVFKDRPKATDRDINKSTETDPHQWVGVIVEDIGEP